MKHKLRILLIDDDEDDFILTRELLMGLTTRAAHTQGRQYSLDWVHDYAAALDALRRQAYDVYLVDYRLGKKDGLALLREARVREYAAPVIFMTGQGNYEVDLEAMRIGASDYLPKNELTPISLERSIRYALEQKRTELEIRRTGERQQLLAALSQDFAEAGLDYQSVLDTIARRVAEATGGRVMIMIPMENSTQLARAAVHDAAKKELSRDDQPGAISPIIDILAAEVFISGQASGIADLARLSAEEKRRYQSSEHTGAELLGSLVIAPLRVQRHSIGVLCLYEPSENTRYQSVERPFLLDLANRAALAIENARLYAIEAERARELHALQMATAELLTTLELEELLDHILYASRNAIPAADRGCLYLMNPDTRILEVRACFSSAAVELDQAALDAEGDLVHRIFDERRPVLLPDVNALLQENPGHQQPFQSMVIAPLTLQAQNLGVILLSSRREAGFSLSDLRLLMSFASTTTAAIHNATLHAEMRKLAITDGLTNFLNRRGLFQQGGREFERARRFNRPLSAILIDLDLFKEINDTYGHVAGDEALRILAERLSSSVRELDIIGRYGGDEFVILLPETDIIAAAAIANRIQNRVIEPMKITIGEAEPIEIGLTASLGISQANPATVDFMTLIQHADDATYQAKRAGGNQISVSPLDEN